MQGLHVPPNVATVQRPPIFFRKKSFSYFQEPQPQLPPVQAKEKSIDGSRLRIDTDQGMGNDDARFLLQKNSLGHGISVQKGGKIVDMFLENLKRTLLFSQLSDIPAAGIRGQHNGFFDINGISL